MILITGATGNLGSSVIEQLNKITTKDQFIATSSSDKGVYSLREKGFQSRKADFNEIDTLRDAFDGVEKIVLISTMEQNRFEQHKNVIDIAKEKGVKHIVYTSLAIKDIETSAVKELMISHFQTEDYLKQSGLTFTILRNTMYADALLQILGQNALKQTISLPGGNGKVPYALRKEMGEAIANLLVQKGHENKVYNITGSQSYSYEEIAKELSNITNTTIDYISIEEQDFVKTLQEIGFPEFAIYLHAGTIKDIKNKQYEIEDQSLETLLGRPTATLQEFIKELFL
jgi:NAD(P)H dehydrogenase (quinone)